MGGFDYSSNVLAGHLCGIPLNGTMAHAFVQSFSGRADLTSTTILSPPPEQCEVPPAAQFGASSLSTRGAPKLRCTDAAPRRRPPRRCRWPTMCSRCAPSSAG